MVAYASLDYYSCKNAENYRIRLNKPVLDALDGVEFVQVLRSQSNEYIVLKPVAPNSAIRKSKLTRRRGMVCLSANGYVGESFLPRYWFGTGDHYKVKKVKDGSICICLKEVLPIGVKP